MKVYIEKVPSNKFDGITTPTLLINLGIGIGYDNIDPDYIDENGNGYLDLPNLEITARRPNWFLRTKKNIGELFGNIYDFNPESGTYSRHKSTEELWQENNDYKREHDLALQEEAYLAGLKEANQTLLETGLLFFGENIPLVSNIASSIGDNIGGYTNKLMGNIAGLLGNNRAKAYLNGYGDSFTNNALNHYYGATADMLYATGTPFGVAAGTTLYGIPYVKNLDETGVLQHPELMTGDLAMEGTLLTMPYWLKPVLGQRSFNGKARTLNEESPLLIGLTESALKISRNKVPEVTNKNTLALTELSHIPTTEAEWQEALKNAEGNVEELARLRKLHAETNGYNTTGYHSTNAEPYTIFEHTTPLQAYFFTPEEQTLYGKRVNKYYLKLDNPYVTDRHNATSILLEDDVDKFKDNGYDSTILETDNPEDAELTVFDNNQIKSADATTYFKDGDPEIGQINPFTGKVIEPGDEIPLAWRDNPSKSDVRFDRTSPDDFILSRLKIPENEILTSEDVEKGIMEAKEYKDSDIYRNLLAENNKEAKELGYLDDSEGINEGLILDKPDEEFPWIEMALRDEGTSGEYSWLSNKVEIDPLQATRNTPYHEGGHWQRFSDNIGTLNLLDELDKRIAERQETVLLLNAAGDDAYHSTILKNKEAKLLAGIDRIILELGLKDSSPETIKRFKDRLQRTKLYYDYKVREAVEDDADPYIKRPYELNMNMQLAGRDIGLKPGDPYPGDDIAILKLEEATKKKEWCYDLKAYRNPSHKNLMIAWKLLTGTYIASNVFGVGMDTMKSLLEDNNNKEKYRNGGLLGYNSLTTPSSYKNNFLEGEELDLTPELIRDLLNKGYQIEYI